MSVTSCPGCGISYTGFESCPNCTQGADPLDLIEVERPTLVDALKRVDQALFVALSLVQKRVPDRYTFSDVLAVYDRLVEAELLVVELNPDDYAD